MINATYRTSPRPAVAYELKTCELCARNFTRQVGTQVKYCDPCRAKPEERDDALWMEEEHLRKKPAKRARGKTRAPRVSKNEPEEELSAAWLKSVAEEKDPANEIRDAWLLH
jgi:hypothetical protein